MQEFRKAIQERLEQHRTDSAQAGDRRDWGASTEASVAVSELEWVLDQLKTTGGALHTMPTQVFKESVRFHQDATFDKDVRVAGNLVVMGTLTTAGFNAR